MCMVKATRSRRANSEFHFPKPGEEALARILQTKEFYANVDESQAYCCRSWSGKPGLKPTHWHKVSSYSSTVSWNCSAPPVPSCCGGRCLLFVVSRKQAAFNALGHRRGTGIDAELDVDTGEMGANG